MPGTDNSAGAGSRIVPQANECGIMCGRQLSQCTAPIAIRHVNIDSPSKNPEVFMQPLAGIRVLSVTVYLAGPFASMSLARLGAEVIKVEIPGRGDPVRGNGPFAGPEGTHARRNSDDDISTRFLKRTQGVKSITLDLKTARGKELFLELAKQSDVVLENLAPGSLRRAGLGYEEVAAVNPGIVYASISGYGQTGAYKDKPAHDPQIQGMSGLMDINGDAEGPPTKVGFYIGDLVTPMFACYSILAALREKDRTGQGQHLDVSMMDTLVSLMFMENLEESIDAGLPLRTGNISRSGPTGLYSAIGGDISITVTSDDQWKRMCDALQSPKLLDDPRFDSYVKRTDNVEEARVEIQNRIGKMTLDEASACLESHDVPCAPVRTAEQVMNDSHFWERGSLVPMNHGAMTDPVAGGVGAGFPVRFSGGELPPLPGAPTLGMHNDEIFTEILGLSDAELSDLSDQGVI